MSSTPSDEDRRAASAVPVTEHSELSVDTLDMVSEAPAFSRTPESPTGVSDTQAVAGGRCPAPDGPSQPAPTPASQACVSGCSPHGGPGTARKVSTVSLKRSSSSDDVRPTGLYQGPPRAVPSGGTVPRFQVRTLTIDRSPVSAPEPGGRCALDPSHKRAHAVPLSRSCRGHALLGGWGRC